MTLYYSNVFSENVNIPIVRQLSAVFDSLPDKELISKLKAHTGRPGYTTEVLWKTYVAMAVLNEPTFANMIRTLKNNPYIAIACGITNENGIPSKFAYSRFTRKFTVYRNVAAVKNVMRYLTNKLYEKLPEFGKNVAIDSTDLKAWSNGAKKPASDPDARWAVKRNTQGRNQFCFGYKLHVVADVKYELPLAAKVTNGAIHDVRVASVVLAEARTINGKFHPDYVICDAGYSSAKLRRLIKRQYRAEPIIKVNAAHKSALFVETKEWQAIYDKRTGIERLFGRLKEYRRLNNINLRRIRKVTVHCYLSLMVLQAQALHNALNVPEASIRQCVGVGV